MTDEDNLRNEIVEAHPYAGAGLDLDKIITRGQHRARRKRNARRGASLVGVAALLTVVGFLVQRSTAGSHASRVRTADAPVVDAKVPHMTSSTTTQPRPTTSATMTDTTVQTTTPLPPATTPVPTPPSVTAPPAGTSVDIPITVQSDAEMKAAGNNGPSSSILAPTSCVVDGTNVTARGGYTNDGFAPNVYNRYGAVVKLYVYTSPAPGYPQGRQIIDVGSESAAPIGGYGPWEVTGPIYVPSGVASRCVVASQPTHDLILAP